MDRFLETYIVSLFSKSTSVTLKQLFLIGSGKRTPSVLFNVEKNKLYVLFALFPELSMTKWEKIIHYLVSEHLLKMEGDQLLLTSNGLIAKAEFLREHPYSNDLDQLRYSATKKMFWQRIIFVTQIFSEYSFQNKKYVPYLSTLENQNSIKKWLSKQGRPMDKLTLDWYEEINYVLQSMDPVHSNFIAGHFVGHDFSGSTSRQLKDAFDLSSDHYTVLIDQLSYQLAQQNEDRCPLVTSLWTHTHGDCDDGLSHSAWVSRIMLEKGAAISDVAKKRRLKTNTIKEHILECVIVENWPYYKRYINEEHYKGVLALFESKDAVTYPEAKQLFEDLDFFSFRLIEIERVRQHD